MFIPIFFVPLPRQSIYICRAETQNDSCHKSIYEQLMFMFMLKVCLALIVLIWICCKCNIYYIYVSICKENASFERLHLTSKTNERTTIKLTVKP